VAVCIRAAALQVPALVVHGGRRLRAAGRRAPIEKFGEALTAAIGLCNIARLYRAFCVQSRNVTIATHTQLRLARLLVDDLRHPWEKPAATGRLSPARVRRGFRNIRPMLPLPAAATDPRPAAFVRC
jgi:hypothetical protein